MANVFTPALALITNTTAQETLRNKVIARELCSTKLFTSLEGKMGASIERPIRSGSVNVVDYARNTDIAAADITYSSDIMLIDKERATERSVIDKFDKKQSVLDLVTKEAEMHGIAMADDIDQTIFAQFAADAGTTYGVTAGAWDSTSTTAATVAEFDGDLFVSMISKFKATMGKNNAKDGERFLVMDHNQYQVVEEKMISLGFNTADAVIGDGFKGKFRGIMIYASNNLLVTTGVVSIVAGVKGSTDLAIQSDVEMTVTQETRNNSTNMWLDALWGVDTPVSLKPQLVEFLVTQEA